MFLLFPHITGWGSCFSLGSRRSCSGSRRAASSPHHTTTHHSSTSHTSLITSLITSHSSHQCGRRSTQLPGGAAARVAARGRLSCGRRTMQSFLEELRGCPWPAAAFRMAGAFFFFSHYYYILCFIEFLIYYVLYKKLLYIIFIYIYIIIYILYYYIIYYIYILYF